MTKYSDERARELFKSCGYGEECEYVKVDGDKFTARCKAHGHEFTRDNSILRKQQKKLRCPECHEQKITAALEYYKQGHSRYECADKFGLTPIQIQNYAAYHGVNGGLTLKDRGEFARAAQKKATKKAAEKARRRGELTRNAKRIMKGFDELSTDLDQWRRQQIALRDIQSSKRVKQRLRITAREIDAMKTYEPKIAICKHCGKEWLFFPRRERYAHHKPPTFCSLRCNNNHHYNREQENHRHRARKYGVAYESGITLKKIEQRDCYTCYLCGGKTNREDKWETANGYIGVGATYPTLDHVKPMCKGGGHTWDNVRLAHKRCNELKGAREQ